MDTLLGWITIGSLGKYGKQVKGMRRRGSPRIEWKEHMWKLTSEKGSYACEGQESILELAVANRHLKGQQGIRRIRLTSHFCKSAGFLFIVLFSISSKNVYSTVCVFLTHWKVIAVVVSVILYCDLWSLIWSTHFDSGAANSLSSYIHSILTKCVKLKNMNLRWSVMM